MAVNGCAKHACDQREDADSQGRAFEFEANAVTASGVKILPDVWGESCDGRTPSPKQDQSQRSTEADVAQKSHLELGDFVGCSVSCISFSAASSAFCRASRMDDTGVQSAVCSVQSTAHAPHHLMCPRDSNRAEERTDPSPNILNERWPCQGGWSRSSSPCGTCVHQDKVLLRS